MGFDQFYQCTVRVLNIAKPARCITHGKRILAVYCKWVTIAAKPGFQGIHLQYIKTKMYKPAIAPIPALKYFPWHPVLYFHQLNLHSAQQFTESPFTGKFFF